MSKKLKLSPWHDGKVKPVHVGVYQFPNGSLEKWFRKWNGKTWMWGAHSIEEAEQEDTVEFGFSGEPWRGVLKRNPSSAVSL